MGAKDNQSSFNLKFCLKLTHPLKIAIAELLVYCDCQSAYLHFFSVSVSTMIHNILRHVLILLCI